MHDYHNLTVWQNSLDLAVDIHRGANRAFTRSKQFGQTNQMRRAAVSIPSSTAEGSSRRTAKDFRRFVDTTLGSGHELDTQLIIATQVGLLGEEAAMGPQHELTQIRAMLVGLKRSASDQRPVEPIPVICDL